MLPASLDTFTSPPPPYMPPMGTPPPYIQPMDTPPPYMPPMGTPPPYMPPMGTPQPYMPPMGTPPPYMPHGLDQSNSDGVLDTHRLYNHHYTNSYGYITPGVLEINTSVQQAPIVLDTEEHFDCNYQFFVLYALICLIHKIDTPLYERLVTKFETNKEIWNKINDFHGVNLCRDIDPN